MSMITVSPKSANFAILEDAGKYGPGQDHEADVELSDFTIPVAKGEGPGFDRQCEQGQWCKFTFHVTREGKGRVKVDHWEPLWENSGSKCLQFVQNIGVTLTPEGSFDPNMVAGRKCVLEVGEKQADKRDPSGQKFFTGRVAGVYGL